ncbi:hypothetical protein D5400_05380 [Georhizobium profundi]|jgi:hypothetical protein|uniref:Uncharacterized protein n=1 Tax=Georhizobium profundi TaxID=2341112 RepID=A0A3Q8XNX3_9HYPH|nr:hypothetical protein [Georhizobium profundi]AZN70780.1 hypothetical protein D5400_05380 [Georhizobium profundi]GLQ36653.1 hypothetical protein GCM10007908_02730 [Rhizobium albus]
MGISDKWNAYEPTKGTLGWVAAGSAVATVVLGFTLGGWVTGGTANEMARDAANASRAELAASVCVDNFRGVDTARADFEELTGMRPHQQRGFVEKAAWAQIPGVDRLGRDAASRCAEMIVALDPSELSTPVAEVVDDEPETAIQ